MGSGSLVVGLVYMVGLFVDASVVSGTVVVTISMVVSGLGGYVEGAAFVVSGVVGFIVVVGFNVSELDL